MIQVFPAHVDAEIVEAEDLTRIIRSSAPALLDGDTVVVTQKAVSTAEGQVPAAVVGGFAPSGDGGARQLIPDRATSLFV